ncbi:hypothetical protein BGZ61DRAFT_22016 [Ilyonectria robusta]|uniref:uncharacterized protein n=1 Tax=Ilyonectria robusta TaxID=1079257 RepID=UPI001E8CCEE0|nr:uncharacterized protein BGZ61DRAFT_22016 [Ilyonectria robusta]KAH8737749.1 hypothetical protein BGZ61DRAFT_22016 [Ilyonectria robusta]
MSIPPQLIRVKRKRVDESPVTFLQFDENAKRHRTGSNWVYQRRQAVTQSPADASARISRDAKPIIHVSSPDDDLSKTRKHNEAQVAQPPGNAPDTQIPKQSDADRLAEPRRFHISRKMMMPTGGNAPGSGVSKKTRYGPAVFVERSRAKATKRASRATTSSQLSPAETPGKHDETTEMAVDGPVEEQRLKRPGVKSRSRSPQPRTPLPASATSPHNQDMTKVAADMNDWVMREIGANLDSMEQEKQKSERAKFKPKAPAKRYQDRHPGVAPATPQPAGVDTAMSDISDPDDDDDEWVIDEYVRIPAHAMTVGVAPTDVGLLVLDGKEDNNLFFGPERDEDDDLDDDEDDENAENYYTADYPEDEVASDDEYGLQPYGYRNGNASDDEEFDNAHFDESDDEMVIEGADEDATMARIKAYMKRSRAFK